MLTTNRGQLTIRLEGVNTMKKALKYFIVLIILLTLFLYLKSAFEAYSQAPQDGNFFSGLEWGADWTTNLLWGTFTTVVSMHFIGMIISVCGIPLGIVSLIAYLILPAPKDSLLAGGDGFLRSEEEKNDG